MKKTTPLKRAIEKIETAIQKCHDPKYFKNRDALISFFERKIQRLTAE